MMTMFQTFRRRRTGVRAQKQAKIIADTSHVEVAEHTRASLLGLPSELRNAVYEMLAKNTVLSPIVSSKRKKRPLPAPVLLVCKQIHLEVRNVLLANATIHFRVPNYEFAGLTTLLDNMQPKTLKALSSNPHLYVRLVLDNAPNRAQIDHISEWLAYRANATSDVECEDEGNQDGELHRLFFRYDAIVKASSMTTGLVNPLNMQVAILAAVLRQLPRLGTEECFQEKSRMYRGLAMYKNRLVGLLESTDVDMPVSSNSNSNRDPMPQVWVPQYR